MGSFTRLYGGVLGIMSFKRVRSELQAVSSESLLEETKSQDHAAKKFRSLLIEKYLDGSTTATDTCLLAFWHGASGGSGAEDLALRPKTASRHGAEHLRYGFP